MQMAMGPTSPNVTRHWVDVGAGEDIVLGGDNEEDKEEDERRRKGAAKARGVLQFMISPVKYEPCSSFPPFLSPSL
jgi:hypothetical protein